MTDGRGNVKYQHKHHKHSHGAVEYDLVTPETDINGLAVYSMPVEGKRCYRLFRPEDMEEVK